MKTPRHALSAKDWTQLNRLLAHVLELEGAARDSWLETLPAEYRHLRTVLIDLLAESTEPLASDERAPTAVARVAADALSAMRCDHEGDRIGPWRLVRLLAEGGMGSVWLADRADGVLQRSAALKLPRAEWTDRALADRMARERSILARLQHPNIAVLYDAGMTAEGRPYLALEYVVGEPIDRYCKAAKADLRQLLELFVLVARAVAFAHTRLVIHRDIKPSNVLVGTDGAPRLLDFGIAKLIEGDTGSPEQTALTRLSDRPLTLAYASPEQVLRQPVTVATDVYSLGVTLYELVTGRRPFTAATSHELEQAILRGEPPRPSRIADDPGRAKALRGDLDAIILKALKRVPEDRYQSASELADDIDRFLNSQPVRAQPDRPVYRLRKFTSRNRGPLLAAAVTTVALITGASLALWQAGVAREQAQEAASLNSFLLSLIRQTDPNAAPETRAADVAMLSAIERRIDAEYSDRPARVLHLRLTVGDAYRNRGEAVAAERVYRKAADQAAAWLTPDNLQLLTAQVRAADSRLLVSRESARRLNAAIEHLRRAGPAGADLLIEALLIQHDLAEYYGVPDFAPPARRFDAVNEAMALALKHFGRGSPQHLRVVRANALLMDRFGDRNEANRLMDEALESATEQSGFSVGSAEYRDLRIRRLQVDCFAPPRPSASTALPTLWALFDEVRAAHGGNSTQAELLLDGMHNCYLSLDDPSGNWVIDAAFEAAAQRERPPSPMLLRRAEASAFRALDNLQDYAATERYARLAAENGAAILDPDLRHRLLRVVHVLKVCALAGQGKAQAAIDAAVALMPELDEEFDRLKVVTRGQHYLFICLSGAQRQLGDYEEAKRTAQTLIDRCAAAGLASQVRCQARGYLALAQAQVDAGEYAAALRSLQERRKQPRGIGIWPDHPLAAGRALLGLGKVGESIGPLRVAYGAWLGRSEPRGHYAAEAEYWLARAYLANHEPRGRWMLAEARKTLAASPLQSHRELAASAVP